MKGYFNSTIQYYLRHLAESGCPDPVREVVTDFTEYMSEYTSKEQESYIKDNIKNTNKQKTINDMTILVKAMLANGRYNEQSLRLILEGLKSL